MAEELGKAFVAVEADTSKVDQQVTQAFEQAGKQGAEAFDKAIDSGTKDTAKKVGVNFAQLAEVIGSAFVVKQVVDFGKAAFAEADEAQRVGKQTEAVIKSTGAAANVTAEAVDKLASTISKKTGIDDEAIASAENLVLTFTNVRDRVGEGNDIFTRAIPLIVDMSKAMGTDASGAAQTLGRALNDPVAGLSALTRVGVQFTDQQKVQIEAMVKSGQIAAAQGLILEEIAKKFGGSAEAQATATDKAAVAIGNLKESVGTALLPAIEKASFAVTKLANAFSALPEGMQTTVVVAIGMVSAFTAVSKSIEIVSGLKGDIDKLTGSVQELGAAATVMKGAFVAGAIVIAGMALDQAINEHEDLNKTVQELASGERDLSKEVAEFTKLQEGYIGAIDGGANATARFTEISEKNIDVAIQLRDALAAQGKDVSGLNEIIDQTIDRAQRMSESEARAAKVLTDDATPAVIDMTEALAALNKMMEAETAAVKEAAAPWDEHVKNLKDADAAARSFAEAMFGTQDAEADASAAFLDLAESVKKSGRSLDIHTESGRANVSALNDIITKSAIWIGKIFEQEGASRNFLAASKLVEDELRATLVTLGFSAAEVEAYVEKWKLVPRNVETNVAIRFRIFPDASVGEEQKFFDQLDAATGDPAATKRLQDNAYDFGKGVGDSVGDGVGAASQDVKKTVDNLMNSIGETLAKESKAGGGGGGGAGSGTVVDAAEEAAKAMTDAIEATIKKNANHVYLTVGELNDALAALFAMGATDVMAAYKNAIDARAESVLDSLKTVLDDIVTEAQFKSDTLAEIFDSFGQRSGGAKGPGTVPLNLDIEKLAEGFASGGVSFTTAQQRLGSAVEAGLVSTVDVSAIIAALEQMFVDAANKTHNQAWLTGIGDWSIDPVTGKYQRGSITVNVIVGNVSHGDAHDVGVLVGNSVANVLTGSAIDVGVRQGSGR